MDKLKQILGNVSKEIADVVGELDTFGRKQETLANHLNEVATSQAGINVSLHNRISSLEASVVGIRTHVDQVVEEIRTALKNDRPLPPDTTTHTPPTTPKPSIPANSIIISLEAVDSSGIKRSNTFISCGVPIGQGVQLKDIKRLVLLSTVQGDEGSTVDFKPIAADFRPTSWWTDASPNEQDSIQWVQVSLIDSLEANETKQYWLVVLPETIEEGVIPFTNPEPNGYLDVIESPGSIFVDTGKTQFILTPAGILSSIVHNKKELISGGVTSCTFDGQTDTFSDLYGRKVQIEYVGPLVCYIVVETVTQSLAIGVQSDGVKSARISTTRRYRFVRGSGVCVVENVIKWEGTKNGDNLYLKDGKTLNGVLGTLWEDSLPLSQPTTDIVVLHDISRDPLSTTGNVSMRQRLREKGRKEIRSYVVAKGSEVLAQGEAAAGMLFLKSGEAIMVAGLQNMMYHEPQEISILGSTIRLQYACDKFWLAHRQGVCVTSMVGVMDKEDDILGIWGDLNLPVRIFAKDASHYNESILVSIPEGENRPVSDSYRNAIKTVATSTALLTQKDGTYGLMTYAMFPRGWDGGYIEAGYAKNSGKASDWQEYFLTGAFTDYYDISSTSAILALIEKDSRYLDLISNPSALKMLFTQIVQTAPEDNWAYSSWSPYGYGAVRSDKNSSHSYYRNLIYYYLLTGNRLVIDIMAKGEKIQLPSLKNQELGGRFPHQRIRAIRFLAHCHYDKKERDFFRQQFILLMERCIKENYVEGMYGKQRIALWIDGKQIIGGENKTPNLYAMSIWDMENLYWYGYYDKVGRSLDTNSPSHPWQMLVKIVKTIQVFAPTVVSGDGSIGGLWARAFKFNWDGTTITNLTVKPESDGHKYLYQPWDTCGMAGAWARAATITKDPEMERMSRELVKWCVDNLTKAKPPMSKLSGLGTVTLGQAVVEEERRTK